ncbi:hypothetical protein GpartN1_g7592.t1 [Galdieria partita]|uniref:RAVE complex protein Rav1 C-terminal domain-containing protein n=1 Tax=Galdieria partita TaxID=83374 RepID=A0A9C7Q410_9RHOD|nr:hypothetical protein GpartN1_g7592.t1 [Galdieria partita]
MSLSARLIASKATLERNGYELFYCHFEPFLVYASWKHLIFVNLRSRDCMIPTYRCPSTIVCLAVCHSTLQIAVALEEGTVLVLHKNNERWIWELQYSLSFISSTGNNEMLASIKQLSWSWNGKRLAAFGRGLVIWQWSVEDSWKADWSSKESEILEKFQSSSAEVLLSRSADQLGVVAYHGTLSPDGKFFAVSGWKSRKIRVWRIDSIIEILRNQSEMPKSPRNWKSRRHSTSSFSSSMNSLLPDISSESFETFGPSELEVGDSGIQHLEWKSFGMGRNALLTVDGDGTFRIWSKIAHSRRSGGCHWMKQVLRAPHVAGNKNISTAGFLSWKDYYCQVEEAVMNPLWSIIVRDWLGFKLSRTTHFVIRTVGSRSHLWRVRGLDDLPFVGFARLEALKDDSILEHKWHLLPMESKSKALDVYQTNLPLEPELVYERALRLRFPSSPPSFIDSVTCYRSRCYMFGYQYSSIQVSDSADVVQSQAPLGISFGHVGNIEHIQSSKMKSQIPILQMGDFPRFWVLSTSYSPYEHWIWKGASSHVGKIVPFARLLGYKACCLVSSFYFGNDRKLLSAAEQLLVAIDTFPPQICLFRLSFHQRKGSIVTFYKDVYDILWNKNLVILHSYWYYEEGRDVLQVWVFVADCVYCWKISVQETVSNMFEWEVFEKDCTCALGTERDGYLYLYLVRKYDLKIYRKEFMLNDWTLVWRFSLEPEDGSCVKDMTLNSLGNLLAILYSNNRHRTWIRLGDHPYGQWIPFYTSDDIIAEKEMQLRSFRWMRDRKDACWYLCWELWLEKTSHFISYRYAISDVSLCNGKEKLKNRGIHELSIQTIGEQDYWLEYRNHQLFLYTEQNLVRFLDWLNPDSMLFCLCLFYQWDCVLFYLHSVIFSIDNMFSTAIYKGQQSSRVQKLFQSFYWTRQLCHYFQSGRESNSFTTSVEYGYSGLSDTKSAKEYFQEALSYLAKDESDDILMNHHWKMKWKRWLSCYWFLWSRELPLDTMALKFLMISKAWYYKVPECSTLPLSIVLLACASDCDKLLFEILFQSEEWTTCYDAYAHGQRFDCLWYFYRYYGVGYWVRRREDLIHMVDTCAKASFQQRQNPMDTCLWYVFLGRTKSLAMLFKVKGMKRFWEFFSGDFDSSDMQVKAKKNAYVALSRHQIELASALFILAGERLEGLKLLLFRLHDVSLFLVASRLLLDWEENDQRSQILELLQSNDIFKGDEILLLETWMALQTGTLDLRTIESHHCNFTVKAPLMLHSTAQVSEFLQNIANVDLGPSSWMTSWMLLQVCFICFQKNNIFQSECKQQLIYPCLLKEYGEHWFSYDPICSLGCLYSFTKMTGISLETLLDDEKRLELWYNFVSGLAELTSEEFKEYKSVCYDLWQMLPLWFHRPSYFPLIWIRSEVGQWDSMENIPKPLRLLSFLWREREWIGLEVCIDSVWKRDWWCKWLLSWNNVLRKLVILCIEGLALGRFLSNPALFGFISNTMESLEPLNHLYFDFNLWKATQAIYHYCHWMMDILSIMEEETFPVEAVLNLLFNSPSLGFTRNRKLAKVEGNLNSRGLRKVVSSHTLRQDLDASNSLLTNEEYSWLPSFSSFKTSMENDVKRQAILYLLKQAICMFILRQWRLFLLHNMNEAEENEVVDVECKTQSILEGFYRDWSQRRHPLSTYSQSSLIRQDSLYQLWSVLYHRDTACRRLLEEGWLVLEGIRQVILERAMISNRCYGVFMEEDLDRESYPHIFSKYNSVCVFKGDKDEAVRSLCLSCDDPCWIAVATLAGLVDISIPYSKLQQVSVKPSFHRSSSASTFTWKDASETKHRIPEGIWKHADQVACVTADPVRPKYASGHMEGSIKLWNFGEAACLGQWKVPNVGRVSSLAFSSFGERLLACHATGQLVIWDEPFLAVGRSTIASPIIIEAFGKRRASQAIFLDDRNLIGVVGSPQGPIASGSSLRIYDIRSPHYDVRPEWTCKVNHGKESRCLLILEDRTKLVTGGLDGSISIVDVRMRHCVAELASVHRGEIQTLGIETNRGRAIFSGCSYGEGKLWDSRTMKCLDTIQVMQRKSSLALTEWNPWRTSSLTHRGILTSCLTDTCLLVGCADGSLRLWGKGWSELSKGPS